MTSRMELKRWLPALVLGLAAGGAAGAWISNSIDRQGIGRPVQVHVEPGGVSESFRSVAKQTLPVVVNISSARTVRQPSPAQRPDLFNDFWFWRFQPPRERRAYGLGSGVIVSAEGHVLTNHHVIKDASELKVVLSDKREFRPKVVGSDPQTDLAVLQIDAGDFRYLPLGDSSRVDVGDVVLAMGNPFGIGQTVTMGIVSAIGRSGLGIEEYEDFIQTDAAVNPGNSGGPLITTRGDLIGIATAIVSGTGGYQGIGFAVPSNVAQAVMAQVLKQGKVIRGWLGVAIQPVDASVAKAFGLKEARGALVGDVTPDSPAARSRLARGDIILALDGEPIADSGDLRMKVSLTAPGTTVKLAVFRQGKELALEAKLEALREGADAEQQPRDHRGAMEGVSVVDASDELMRELGLPRSTQGAVVTNVMETSPAAEAGLRRGDVIQEVDRRAVASAQEIQKAIEAAGNRPVLLLVNRRGRTLYIVVEPR